MATPLTRTLTRTVAPRLGRLRASVRCFSSTRVNDLASLASSHCYSPAYSNRFQPTHTVAQFLTQFANIANGARLTDIPIVVCGRITSKRAASSNLLFFDVRAGGCRVQAMASKRSYDDQQPFKELAHIRVGDIVCMVGFPGKSDKGELSIIPRRVHLLSPCLHEIPAALTSSELRYRNKHVDLLVNTEQLDIIRMRNRVMTIIRSFLHARDFIEAETPILWPQSGGASARPFATASNAFGSALPLYLRIAPELFLKQLVIGGADRVFEVSRVFRNEGVDATHNPEFTTIELYQAYANYRDMMALTQELLTHIVQQLFGTTKITIGGGQQLANADGGGPIVLDFSQPFAEVDVMSALTAALGRELPNPNNEENAILYKDICDSINLHVSPPFTCSRLLDKLIGNFLEPLCVQPTFLVHHPNCLSPLARSIDGRPGSTERFELFIAGKEYINAYSELNDPVEQRQRMRQQARLRDSGDAEAQPVDEEYCQALEYGLPPTAGWGIGVDRLIMMLANKSNIRDVIAFPVMKPNQDKEKEKTNKQQASS